MRRRGSLNAQSTLVFLVIAGHAGALVAVEHTLWCWSLYRPSSLHCSYLHRFFVRLQRTVELFGVWCPVVSHKTDRCKVWITAVQYLPSAVHLCPWYSVACCVASEMWMRSLLLLVVNTAYIGSYLPTFRDNLLAPSSKVKPSKKNAQRFFLDFFTMD